MADVHPRSAAVQGLSRLHCGSLGSSSRRSRPQDCNYDLWLAILGVTDHYLRHNIDQESYRTLVDILQEQVRSKNDPDDAAGVLIAQESKHVDEEKDDIPPAGQEGFIGDFEDMQFPLLRNWNLYESMLCSNFVNTRLGLWIDDEGEKLAACATILFPPHELLQAASDWMNYLYACPFHKRMQNIGRPKRCLLLPAYTQPCPFSYALLRPEVRKTLRKNLAKVADNFGLDGVFFPSFYRRTGRNSLRLFQRSNRSLLPFAEYNNPTSAADCVHAVTALLECPRSFTESSTSSSPTSTSKLEGSSRTSAESKDSEPLSGGRGATAWNWKESFWDAYYSLSDSSDGRSVLVQGIEHAKKLQVWVCYIPNGTKGTYVVCSGCHRPRSSFAP